MLGWGGGGAARGSVGCANHSCKAKSGHANVISSRPDQLIAMLSSPAVVTLTMSIHNMPSDSPPTPPAPTRGSRSEQGGLKCDCTSGSMSGGVPSLVPLLTTRTIGDEQLRCGFAGANATNATEVGALCSEYLHEDYQPHVGDA
ncbi:hypothetical protein HaLaN_10256 [Haematococcus lacustris]|uniref:Uncharacterized protein n=1 Tax=Haematococcus lacustris TaxID=44745 RepID=A0A699Z593_HAELA|nr:hypothetical protein HaLaN_10256 [Haematococcus lacustris]